MIGFESDFDYACFEMTEHGRLIRGNRKFCRLFGFEEDEIPWHYVTDLYRYAADWDAYRLCNDPREHHFVARMRNRKGRSFKCGIARETVVNEEGKLVFRNKLRRLAEAESFNEQVADTSSLSVVFLAKCAHCGNQIRVNSIAETKYKVLCSECAAKEYPEAFNLKTAEL